jgi:hypothetical protein
MVSEHLLMTVLPYPCHAAAGTVHCCCHSQLEAARACN